MLNLTCSINWCMRLNLVGWTRDFLQPHSCEIMIIRFKSHLEKFITYGRNKFHWSLSYNTSFYVDFP